MCVASGPVWVTTTIFTRRIRHGRRFTSHWLYPGAGRRWQHAARTREGRDGELAQAAVVSAKGSNRPLPKRTPALRASTTARKKSAPHFLYLSPSCIQVHPPGIEKEAEKGKEKVKEKEKEKEKGRDRPREKFINVTKEDLWALQTVLDSRKSSLSSTYKKNSGANNKVYDLNQRPMAALDRLAEVYETFEDTWDIVVKESADGDMFFLLQKETRLTRWRRPGSIRTGPWKCWRIVPKSLDGAFREFSNCRTLHEAAWVDVQEAIRRLGNQKKHTREPFCKEGLRRAAGDHVKAEEVLNNSVDFLGTLVKDTAGATHSLTCGPKQDPSKMRWR